MALSSRGDENHLSSPLNPPVPIYVSLIMGFVKSVTFLYEMISWPMYSLLSSGEPVIDDQGPVLAYPVIKGNFHGPWRCVEALSDQRLSQSLFPSCVTLDELWMRAVRLWPEERIIGVRELLSVDWETQANGRKFKKLTQGGYRWFTYRELEHRIDGVTRGLLAHLNLRLQEDRVLIFAETRVEWMLVAQSCFRCGIPLVTLYSTLGDDALVHGVNESEVNIMFTSDELLEKVLSLLPRLPNITHVIYLRDAAHDVEGDDFKVPSSVPGKVQVISLYDLESAGMKAAPGDTPMKGKRKIQRDDLALIMYTSGSTGAPKGVEITHANLMCSLSGQSHRLPVLTNRDTYIGYLPLAHVLELCCELVLLSRGIPVAYGHALTLTDNSSKVKSGTQGDLSALRPTLMACVPTILDRLHKTVWEKVNEGGPLGREMFRWCLEYKTRRLTYGFSSLLMDRLIFRKVRKVLGGRVRLMLSGGAPLSHDAQEFINACFCRIIQGYGLTETCGAGTLGTANNLRSMHVGAPLRCLEIKLRPWEEGCYSPEDKPHPRGEVIIGGECVVRGYFKQTSNPSSAEAMQEFVVDERGTRWFCTGDIGQFNSDGTLSIIDRKKDLVKLQTGEYVSLGKVELALSVCPLVETICIFADSTKDSVIALMVPKRKALLTLATAALGVKEIELQSRDFAVICREAKVRQAVLRQLQDVAREKRLQRTETPMAVFLDHTPWTPDTGLVTDALKLKRRVIQTHFQEEIDRLYCSKM